MTRNLTSVAALVEAGLVDAQDAPALDAVIRRYAVALTPAVAEAIDPLNPADPIARQFVPTPAELEVSAEELDDPIGDDVHRAVKGIVHRYPDRVLLMPTHACAVYCRFCFRREVVGGPGSLNGDDLEAALDYIRRTPGIWEVILTGGDPLTLSPRRIGALIQALDAIPHVGVIRIHTRLPVVDPARIDTALVAALTCETALFVSLHANHPREFTDAARAAIRRITGAGIPMISQSVLLKGVNDDPATLEALMRAFVANRIKPYYLHHADLAPGTAGFRTTIAAGQALMRHLRGRVSGLCQPTYVLDIPGGHGKSPIDRPYLAEDQRSIEDWQGNRHPLPPGR